MSETTSPEQLDDKAGVAEFISIHIQRAKKIVVTKAEGQPYAYLGEVTYDDPEPIGTS